MQLKVITPAQYASLVSLYMNVEDFSFGMVVLDKNSGAILISSDTSPPIVIKNNPVVYGLGSTGRGLVRFLRSGDDSHKLLLKISVSIVRIVACLSPAFSAAR